MICGLFSSFDPMVYSSSVMFKWMKIFLMLAFFWDFYVLRVNLLVFCKKLFLEIVFLLKQSFFNPKDLTLLLSGVFFFFLIINLSGLIPYYFSYSSHLSVNLAISLPFWIGSVLNYDSIKNLTSHLLPLGSPFLLWPLLVYVESVSMLIRPFTLGIRLMANVVAGHLILNLISDSSPLFFIPFTPLFGGSFIFFELCVSFVQAYVFMLLIFLYWEESSN